MNTIASMHLLRVAFRGLSGNRLPAIIVAAVSLCPAMLNGAPTRHDQTGTARTAGVIRSLEAEADRLILAGRADAALSICRRMCVLAPHDERAALRLADVYARTGDCDRAITHFKDIIDHDSLFSPALTGLADVMRKSGRLHEAEGYYSRALRQDPYNTQCLVGLVLAYVQERDFLSARRIIDRAAAIDPQNGRVLRLRGDILAWGNQVALAETAYREALRIDPGSADVYQRLGTLYRSVGDDVRAIDAMTKAHLLDPGNPQALVDLADACLDAGMIREAENWLRDLFALDPDNPRGYDILRRLEARHAMSYSTIVNGYAKPAFLLASNVIVGMYFWRRRHRLTMRSHFLVRCIYSIWPLLATTWGVLLVFTGATGWIGAEVMTQVAEFGTLTIWTIAFLTLIWVTRGQRRTLRKAVLAIGAHPDDIELGCGGTLSRYKENGYQVYGLVITSGEAGNPHTNEKIDRRNEAAEGASILGLDGLWVYRFKDSALYSQFNEVREVIEAKIHETRAEVVLTQSPCDIHQDHKTVFEATKIAARGDRTLMCYEDVSTEAHFAANYFVDITDFIEDKLSAVRAHATQKRKPYMDPGTICGRAAHRGLQSGVKYAEAFLLYRGLDLWPSS